ncbi:MAG TPA: hypothetical protein VGO54_13975 [Bradyrhizobium sp.]|jgi:hypothetical protein|nr:hypothetical protein [Bradyrhizobium sp.]
MLSRVFAVACDAAYFRGLCALLNSLWIYHRGDIPVFLYHRGLSEEQLAEIGGHPANPHLFAVPQLAFASAGMWEAKQQIFAHCIGRARCVFLLDADVVLLSAVYDVFELAELGRIVSSADGSGMTYDSHYAAYGHRLPGLRQPYVNTGALCLDVVRHWDVAGLWAFSSQYGAYSPGAGAPLSLPGHGDQGLFNAIAALLGKEPDLHVLPAGPWCDSGEECLVKIRRRYDDGRIDVWNLIDDARQRLLHSTGSKWWTPAGAAHLSWFCDKYECFQYFAQWAKAERGAFNESVI